MAGLLNLLGEPARAKIAVNAQRASHHKRILRSRILKKAHVPQSMHAIFREGPSIKPQIIGSVKLGAHAMLLSHIMGRPAANDKVALGRDWLTVPECSAAHNLPRLNPPRRVPRVHHQLRLLHNRAVIVA